MCLVPPDSPAPRFFPLLPALGGGAPSDARAGQGAGALVPAAAADEMNTKPAFGHRPICGSSMLGTFLRPRASALVDGPQKRSMPWIVLGSPSLIWARHRSAFSGATHVGVGSPPAFCVPPVPRSPPSMRALEPRESIPRAPVLMGVHFSTSRWPLPASHGRNTQQNRATRVVPAQGNSRR